MSKAKVGKLTNAQMTRLMENNGIDNAFARVYSVITNGISHNITNNIIRVIDNLIRFNSEWSADQVVDSFAEQYVTSYKNNVLAEEELNSDKPEEEVRDVVQSARAQHSNTKTPYVAEILYALNVNRKDTLELTNPFLTQEANDKLESVGNRKRRLRASNDRHMRKTLKGYAEAMSEVARCQEALDIANKAVRLMRNTEIADSVPSLDFAEAFETVKVAKFSASARKHNG